MNWREIMRTMPRKGSDGLALIMVLVMVIIFAALIVAVVISASMAMRRAHYYKDKAIALQIAEAGLQEILFKMNYEKYGYGTGHLYPFGDGVLKETQVYPLGLHPTDYALVAIDPDATGQETRLVSTGRYMGRSAKVYVDLRGYAKLGDALNYETAGIPEAFNKKVIYAKTVNFVTAYPGTRTLKGNIPTSTTKPSSFPWTDAMWTETINLVETYIGSGVWIADIVHFETENCQFFLSLPNFGPEDRYDNNGYLYNAAYPTGIEVNTIPGGTVFWNGSDTYKFGRSTDDMSAADFDSSNRNISVEANVIIPSNAGNVTIDGYLQSTGGITINKSITTALADDNFAFVTNNFSLGSGVSITGDLVLKGSSLTLNHTINGMVKCDNDIAISGGIIAGDVQCDNDIAISGGTINGNLLSHGNIAISGGPVINGCVVCYHPNTAKIHSISITGNATIDASSSGYDAAVYIHNSHVGSTGTINIDALTPPSIILGENQKAGVVILAGTGTITIMKPFTFTPAASPPDQFAIVNYSEIAAVNINANNFKLIGSIYSYKDISLNDSIQRITGILVAGNTVQIGNNSHIIYDSAPYLNNPTVYRGFHWGRRKYLPLPGTREVTW